MYGIELNDSGRYIIYKLKTSARLGAKKDNVINTCLVGAALAKGGTVQRKESVNRAETGGQEQEQRKLIWEIHKW